MVGIPPSAWSESTSIYVSVLDTPGLIVTDVQLIQYRLVKTDTVVIPIIATYMYIHVDALPH